MASDEFKNFVDNVNFAILARVNRKGEINLQAFEQTFGIKAVRSAAVEVVQSSNREDASFLPPKPK